MTEGAARDEPDEQANDLSHSADRDRHPPPVGGEEESRSSDDVVENEPTSSDGHQGVFVMFEWSQNKIDYFIEDDDTSLDGLAGVIVLFALEPT
ncbi:MAG: hypothetical protein AB1486_34725 [Planctomycetota bacterium]